VIGTDSRLAAGVRGVLLAALVCVLAGQAAAAPPRPNATPPGGKPLAPIAMRYETLGEPALGQAMTIAVVIAPEQPLDNARVTVRADSALVLESPAGALAFGTVAAGQELRVVVRATPQAQSVLRLNVSISGDMQGRHQSRNLSIPIRLGPVARTPALLKLDAAGNVVHSLPARRPPRGILR